jgi:twinfilin-like protein
MSHSSGITVSHELLEKFADAREHNNVRWIKAVIDMDNELVNFVTSGPMGASIEADFGAVQGHLQPKEPCYILFRLEDSTNSSSSNPQRWLMMTYAPDIALIKAKMLIASTRDNAKKMLGLNYFAMEMYAATKEEMSYAEYDSILNSKKIDAPMTASEVVLKQEARMEIHSGVSREYVHSVQFPMDKAALSACEQVMAGSLTVVQLQVDPEKETIDFVKSGSCDVHDLAAAIPSDAPSFTLFRWRHNHDGGVHDAVVFIYCCPMSAKVKLKMLYSTVNKAAIGAIEETGLKITKKVEVESPSEITEKDLLLELHPETSKNANKKLGQEAKFSKPMRPGKGRARMTRS